jgi:hypothetical protein
MWRLRQRRRVRTTFKNQRNWPFYFFLVVILLSVQCDKANCANIDGDTGTTLTVDPFCEDLNTNLMLSTFKIMGQSHPRYQGLTGIVSGTAFILTKTSVREKRLLLVTASHILSDIGADHFLLRFRVADGDGWTEIAIPVTISQNGILRYMKHPEADVAVLDLMENIPLKFHALVLKNLKAVSTDELADEQRYKTLELHPGDDLNCVSFPLSMETAGMFPILRGGKIASYPLIPTHKYQRFLFDFEVNQGCSGGPVYISNYSRATTLGVHLGPTTGIVGILSGEHLLQGQPIKMGVVVPSTFILDVIQRMN